MHFGKSNILCPELNVHNNSMKSSETEKYLGDLISTELNNKKIISDRKNKGIGYNAQIMSLLNDISLGSHYFDIGKVLREAMLINGMLFNADAWYDLTLQDISALEIIDKSLLRNILKAHSKTALEALFLEMQTIMFSFDVQTT